MVEKFSFLKISSILTKPYPILTVRYGAFGDLVFIAPLFQRVGNKLPSGVISKGMLTYFGILSGTISKKLTLGVGLE